MLLVIISNEKTTQGSLKTPPHFEAYFKWQTSSNLPLINNSDVVLCTFVLLSRTASY